MGLNADQILDFRGHSIGFGRRQINLVEYGNYFQILFDRAVAVGNTLRFHTLRGIDNQQCAFAGSQRT